MAATQFKPRNTGWLYGSLLVILLCISIFESFKVGFGPAGTGESGEILPIARRQATNTSDTTTSAVTTTPESTSAAPPTTSTPDPTTSAAPATTTTPAASNPATTTPGSADTGGGSTGGSSGSDGTGATTTVVTDATTTAAAAAPVATGGSTDSSNTGSGSSTPAGSGTGDSTGTSSGSSGSGTSGDSGTANTGSGAGAGAGTDTGTDTGTGTGSGSGTTGSGSGDTGGTGNAATGLATASGAPAPTDGTAATGAGTAAAAPAGAPTTASGVELWTSLGTPVTLSPITVVSSAARTLITTGKDGKPTPTTSRFVSTFVSTPVSTPSSVGSSSWTSTNAATASPNAGGAGEKASKSGITTGGKVAVGILIPLLAIIAGIGIAIYLMKKNKKQEVDDEKSGKPAISGPLPVIGNPLKRFSALKVQNTEHPDHEPFNQPTLPPLRTPAMSLYDGNSGAIGAGTALGAGAGAGAGAGTSFATPAVYKASSDANSIGGTTIGAAAPLGRPVSTHSTISSVSAYSRESRYSHYSMQDATRTRSPSPPPLPSLPTQQPNFLESNSLSTGGATPASHPYDSLMGNARSGAQRESTAFDAASAYSALSFTSDHPSQSASKAPSITGVSVLDPEIATAAANRRSTFLSVGGAGGQDDATKHLSTISDAPGADARATQLFYPFGDQVMTPGGRIVPKPVGPNPKNINPGLGGMRPDGSRSGNIGRNASLSRRPSTAGAPTLPQLPEVQEDGAAAAGYAGLDFDFGGAIEPLTLMDDPSSTRPATSASTAPVRTKAPTPEPPSLPRPSEESTLTGMRPRAPSVGYRRYRPDNL